MRGCRILDAPPKPLAKRMKIQAIGFVEAKRDECIEKCIFCRISVTLDWPETPS